MLLEDEDGDEEEEDEECELEQEGLMNQVGNIWDIIEFAFFKGQGGWVDLLSLMVRILKTDFNASKKGTRRPSGGLTDSSWINGNREDYALQVVARFQW